MGQWIITVLPMIMSHGSHLINNCEAIKQRKTQTVSPLQKLVITRFVHHCLLKR